MLIRVFAIDYAVNRHGPQVLTGMTTLLAIIFVVRMGAENLSHKTLRIQEDE